MAGQPNILIITTDQQHHGMMSCAGNPWLQTPAMDRIAAWGTRFQRAYCSNPVCVPSRFSWWTGRMPISIGLRHNESIGPVPAAVHHGGLGHLMRAAGYRAAFAGKQHLPGDLNAQRLGFEVLTRDERDRCAVEAAAFVRAPHDRPWCLAVNFINPHDICYHAIRAFGTDEQSRRLLEIGAREIAELDECLRPPNGIGDDAFFAYHCPPLPANHAVQDDEPEAIRRIVALRPFRQAARDRWTERDWRLHRWAYHRLTERVDRQIAVVVDALEASGQLEDTVIIFTSDHGDHDGSHKLEHKTIFYEEAARIPLIVARPGHGPAGAADDAHIANNGLDLMATCCDYAGIEQPAHNRGLSLRPLAEGRSVSTWREGAYMENQIGFAYVTRTHKYCRYDYAGDEEQLYDLVGDPGETRSVHLEAAHALALGRHRDLLATERAAHRELQVMEASAGAGAAR